jgi:hypothetical protein
MIINHGTIKYNGSRGVFGQKVYIEDEENKKLIKIIICTSEEFLAEKLKKHLKEVMNNNINDVDIQKWFKEKNNNILNEIEKVIEKNNLKDVIIYSYPNIPGMIEAAESLFL